MLKEEQTVWSSHAQSVLFKVFVSKFNEISRLQSHQEDVGYVINESPHRYWLLSDIDIFLIIFDVVTWFTPVNMKVMHS